MKNCVYIILGCCLCGLSACGSINKQIKSISENSLTASLELPADPIVEEPKDAANTIAFTDIAGATYILMQAQKDENGDMVAVETIDAAKVTARFRNVAERQGEVHLQFEVTVPGAFLQPAWQLRFYPKMRVQDDEEYFPALIITGHEYRAWQLRGLEMYETFLRRIDRDSTKIVNDRLLDIFLQRHNSSVPADLALEHYTRSWMKDLINHKQQRAADLFERVRLAENVKADTVVSGGSGPFTYSYEQVVYVKDGWKKVDVTLDGEIFVENQKIYSIGESEKLTFYISSLRDFLVEADESESSLNYNAAVTALCVGKNYTAIKLLSGLESNANVRYLRAVAYSRIGDEASAVTEFVNACRLNSSFIHRGNLDPEISYLVTKYHLEELFY